MWKEKTKDINIKTLKKNSQSDHSLKMEKYVPSILNFINGTMASSQTSPRHVGQLSDIFQEYLSSNDDVSRDGWKNFYLNKNTEVGTKDDRTSKNGRDIIDSVIQKNMELKKTLIEKLQKVNEATMKEWVENLMFDKTYYGFVLEKPIAIEAVKIIIDSNRINLENLRKSDESEESLGIDYVYKHNNESITIQIKSSNTISNPVVVSGHNDCKADYIAILDTKKSIIIVKKHN